MPETRRLINAAGKLTALGGSAQSEAVARAQAEIARQHVDLAQLRGVAGETVARLTGAEAGCVTSGAAAGITIAVAALLTGHNLRKVQQIPYVDDNDRILLQAGHAIDFGAPVVQMIALGGGDPWIVGSTNAVSERLFMESLQTESFAGYLFVQSHHCVQDNMISLERCIELCHDNEIPVIVDAAAEEDLTRYIALGADLVIYSGGKAFGGPTVGFIVGKYDYIAACELQFRGIARTMKVGKEQIQGLITALDEYTGTSPEDRRNWFDRINRYLVDGLAGTANFEVYLKADEAGRGFERVAIKPGNNAFNIRDLVQFLAESSPGIRTRNHQLDQGILLIDPRELTIEDAEIVLNQLLTFDRR